MDKYNFVSFLGVIFILFFAWAFSENKRNMNWRVILWGIGIQSVLAVFIFIFSIGTDFFTILNTAVIKVLESATAGSQFVFGRLALSPGQTSATGETSIGFMLAFQAFPTIIFFSALIGFLYYLRIMPLIIKFFAKIFSKLMKISGVESLVASSNIFVGIESILTVKPYLKDITRSEICTILTAGMATVASNVLALYVFSLKEQFPSIAAHLVSASLLSAPAAVVLSKILVPESDSPKTLGVNVDPHYDKDGSFFEAIINGANAGLKMIVGIVALLIAVLGLVALFDLFLGFFGSKINVLFGWDFVWSLKGLMGKIFYPFVLLIGVPFEDARIVSPIIGEKLIMTEVYAYHDLATVLKQGLLQHPRSAVITVYALCGFTHLASMSIFVGGFSALVPEKTKEIVNVAPKALVAATLACLLTAAIAGLFFNNSSILLG